MKRLVIEGAIVAVLALGANGCERDALSSARRIPAATGADGGTSSVPLAAREDGSTPSARVVTLDTRDGGWPTPQQITSGVGGTAGSSSTGGSGGTGGIGPTGGSGGVGPTGGSGGAAPTGGAAGAY